MSNSSESRNISPVGSVTDLLDLVRVGEPNAKEELFKFLVGELHRCVIPLMQNERVGHTLGASGVVNEVVLKLLRENAIKSAKNRRQLYVSANRAIRQVLVDHARRRNAVKRGGDRKREHWDSVLEVFTVENGCQFEDLHNALNELNKESPRQREVVENRFFAGASTQQIAELLGISPATVERDWRLAKVKLYAMICKGRKESESIV